MTQKSIVLQPDDLTLLRLLGHLFLLLSVGLIQRLFPHRSPRAMEARLRKLMRAKFLNQRFVGGEAFLSRPQALYSLGPEGQKIIDPDGIDPKVQARIRQARSISSTALPHMLFADSIHITFLKAGRDFPDYELVDYIPQYDQVWKTLSEHGFPFRPDGYAEYSKNDKRFHCFIEADRGTYRARHLRRRLETYAAYAASGLFSVHFSSTASFRVLLIAATRGRARALLKTVSAYQTDLFWVTTRHDFDSRPLFDPYWLVHTTHAARSLDEPTPSIPEAPPPPQLAPAAVS